MAAFFFTKAGDQKDNEVHTASRRQASTNARAGSSRATGNASPTYATPLTGLIVLTTMFASLTCIPYFASRRHLLRLEGTIRELSQTNRLMRRELSLNASRAQSRYDEQLTGLNEEVSRLGKGVEEIRGGIAQDTGRMTALQSTLTEFRQHQIDSNSTLDDQILSLANEMKRQEEVTAKHESHFREIGATLGDIAGFMHEMQIGYGLFPDTKKTQRVESMRQVALRLQSMEQAKEDKDKDKEMDKEKETLRGQPYEKEPFETSPYD